MSNTYLRWARKNLAANALESPQHLFHRADVLRWVAGARKRYGLIFLDPPTYSRSKTMEGDFDIQRDHAHLIRDTVRLLASGGILIFSTNRRKFELGINELEGLEIEDITEDTIPVDFKRRPEIHKCFKIRMKNAEHKTRKKSRN
jgi:23S rRNA (guanine2445-N2)-methyltransferase / 23S rRNA (guanine2069-N7)-methyltransferase